MPRCMRRTACSRSRPVHGASPVKSIRRSGRCLSDHPRAVPRGQPHAADHDERRALATISSARTFRPVDPSRRGWSSAPLANPAATRFASPGACRRRNIPIEKESKYFNGWKSYARQATCAPMFDVLPPSEECPILRGPKVRNRPVPVIRRGINIWPSRTWANTRPPDLTSRTMSRHSCAKPCSNADHKRAN
jgi:hypothetical protein